MRLFTVGFTKRSAREFFTLLQEKNVRRVVDVRLNNTSQLAGFAKARDLEYFLQAIAGIDYIHLPELAPTQELLDAYVKDKGAWADYERGFLQLLTERNAMATVAETLLDGDCLLCSELTPEHCHRRVIAEILRDHRGDVEIVHL
ncbi:MAG TPA: DUF488 domain-containing protein [Phycisphaerales bacterium]|nr:DUF488 domain-containing protein [Phycisphaerales bacterium]